MTGLEALREDNMKKLSVIIIALALAAGLAGCFAAGGVRYGGGGVGGGVSIGSGF